MKACKIIGGLIALAGAIVGIMGAIEKEAWGAAGGGLMLLGAIISEKIPEWFDLD